MPARLIPRLIGWLARHLVVITVAVFVVVGIRLAGGLESVLADLEAFTASFWAPPVAEGNPERPAAGSPTPTDVQEGPRTGTPSSPRYIGGIIPIQGNGTTAGREPGTGGQLPAAPGRARDLPDEAIRAEARAAYWDGRLDDAESRYLELLQRRPEDADLFGELGNLYLSQGLDGRAADAYYAAGVRLTRQGDFARARQVADLLLLRGDPRGEALRR